MIMNRFISFVLACLLLSQPSHAQQKELDKASFCCIYQHTVKTFDLKGHAVSDSTIAILEVGDGVAKYGDYFAYAGQKPNGYAVEYMEGDPRASDWTTVYQNYPRTGSITVREGLLPCFYSYEEPIALNWKFVEGQENLLGYKCKRATAEYGGRTWAACYAENIPSMNGPWKLTGLPGFILKAESTDGVHRFEAKCLYKVAAQSISFEKDETDVSISRHKFITHRNSLKTDKRWPRNAGYYLNGTDIKSVTIIKKNDHGLAPVMIVNNIGLPVNGGFEHLFQPLELY